MDSSDESLAAYADGSAAVSSLDIRASATEVADGDGLAGDSPFCTVAGEHTAAAVGLQRPADLLSDLVACTLRPRAATWAVLKNVRFVNGAWVPTVVLGSNVFALSPCATASEAATAADVETIRSHGVFRGCSRGLNFPGRVRAYLAAISVSRGQTLATKNHVGMMNDVIIDSDVVNELSEGPSRRSSSGTLSSSAEAQAREQQLLREQRMRRRNAVGSAARPSPDVGREQGRGRGQGRGRKRGRPKGTGRGGGLGRGRGTSRGRRKGRPLGSGTGVTKARQAVNDQVVRVSDSSDDSNDSHASG